jgi:hypothetical protein
MQKPKTQLLRPKATRVSSLAEPPCRVAVRFSEADQFCRRVKIRVQANPHSTAARLPRFFPAGFRSKPGRIVRTVEAPVPLPGPVRRLLFAVPGFDLGGQGNRP